MLSTLMEATEIGKAELECLLGMACATFDVPLAVVSLKGRAPVWFSTVQRLDGWAVIGACGPALEARGPLLVSDTREDARFGQRAPGADAFAPRFYAGFPLLVRKNAHVGTLAIIDAEPGRLTGDQEERLKGMAGIVAALVGAERNAQAARRLERRLEEQKRLVVEQQNAVARYRKMYERSSALAKIGTWECDLITEELTWTDGVYDIFEIPRGAHITRQMILDLYYEDSRREMEAVRAMSIAQGASYSMDIHVRTIKGNERWVRLSVDVEAEDGRPVRIFGTKQDVTAEKVLMDRMRRMAEHDPLTGLANRGMFEERLSASLVRAPASQALSALVVIDLDGFKAVNDTFGHAAGDACLKATADRLRAAFGTDLLIGRIGGDEFAVLFQGPRLLSEINEATGRAVQAIRAPILWDGQVFDVGASVGIAIPADPCSVSLTELFAEADAAMYAAKKAGRIRAAMVPEAAVGMVP